MGASVVEVEFCILIVIGVVYIHRFLSHSDSYSLVRIFGLVYFVSERGATPHAVEATIFPFLLPRVVIDAASSPYVFWYQRQSSYP